MTKKQKFWIAFGATATTILVPLITIGCVFALVSMVYNPSLSKAVVEYCSDDDNYYSYTAVFKDIIDKENGRFRIVNIEPEKDWRGNNPNKDGAYSVRLFSYNPSETFESFSPYDGLSFEFVFIPVIGLGPSSRDSIVQIKVNNYEILSINEGKASLIEWAKKVH